MNDTGTLRMINDSKFAAKFGKNIISFYSLFHQYAKARKEYIFNENIPHNCPREVCEKNITSRKRP